MNVATIACGDTHDHLVPIPRELEGVVYVDHLCGSPGDLGGWLAEADRVVMIVHPGALSLGAVQRSVRNAGIDPLGVQYVSADTIAGDARRAAVLLAGAAARAQACAASRPEHSRPRFGGRRSRRELLSVPQPYYEALPAIDKEACAAADGCRACVVECPQSAYRWSSGDMLFERDACVTCGRCLTACPTGAIENPTLTGDALARQITALVSSAAPDPIGVAFVCRQRTRAVIAAGWAEVEVPCTGMIPATWPLGALLMGAGGAAVLPCSASGCELGNDDRSADAVTLARSLLVAAGLEPRSVAIEPGALVSPMTPAVLHDPFGVHGPTEVAMALQSISVTERPLTGSGASASRGIVEIDPGVCTVCLACTQTCPTGALERDAESEKLAVSFDAASCTGCSQCVPVCPEVDRGAIRVERRIDTRELGADRRRLVTSRLAACEVCGNPVASAAMLDRISDLLGEEHTAAMGYLSRRCLDCRGI